MHIQLESGYGLVLTPDDYLQKDDQTDEGYCVKLRLGNGPGIELGVDILRSLDLGEVLFNVQGRSVSLIKRNDVNKMPQATVVEKLDFNSNSFSFKAVDEVAPGLSTNEDKSLGMFLEGLWRGALLALLVLVVPCLLWRRRRKQDAQWDQLQMQEVQMEEDEEQFIGHEDDQGEDPISRFNIEQADVDDDDNLSLPVSEEYRTIRLD